MPRSAKTFPLLCSALMGLFVLVVMLVLPFFVEPFGLSQGAMDEGSVLRRHVADRIFLRRRRRKKLLETLIKNSDFTVQVVDFPGKLRVGGKHLAHHDEDADDEHIDFCCPVAAEDAGEHGDTLFSKGKWEIAASAPRLWSCSLQEQRFKFVRSKLKDKIIGKAFRIAAHRKVKVARGHTIEFSEVLIKHHFLATDQVDAACDAF